MSAGDKWLLEDCSILRLADVLDHEDLWMGASEYKRLRCPVCSYSYQHVETWQTVPGRDNYEAGWGRPRGPGEPPHVGRVRAPLGVVLWIPQRRDVLFRSRASCQLDWGGRMTLRIASSDARDLVREGIA